MEKYLKSNICVLPWTSLEIGVNGGARPCCLYDEQIPEAKVYEQSLDKIQKSEYMNNLRQKFKEGERPEMCTRCWSEEDAGKVSKRMHTFYKMNVSLDNWTPDSEPQLKFIDFKLGNVCNLKCRICGSWSSSKWAKEEMDYGPNPFAEKNLKEGGWPKREVKFFTDIQPVLQHVEFFEFTGGEPFMIQNHFKILEYCVEKGYAKNQHIHYNTNGTQLPPKKIFDLWSKFKRVEIAFSIDDIGKQFEYQRYGADWKKVNENLETFKKQASDNIDFQICSTINIFNILSIAKLSGWVDEFKPKSFYVNTCFEPIEFNIQTLPETVKIMATRRYGEIKEFKPTINFMNNKNQWSKTLDDKRRYRIKQTDAYRKENFSKTFPTLNNLLKVYE